MTDAVGVYKLECGHVIEALDGDAVDAVPCPWCGEPRRALCIAWSDSDD